jgi:hypothetical protein
MKPPWLTTIGVGLVYVIVGLAFGARAGAAGTQQMLVLWRYAAWIVSGIFFGGQILYELYSRGRSPRAAALVASASAALGAFGLALAANVHAHTNATGNYRALSVALVAWPLLCSVPAFLVALSVATGLKFVRRSR